MLGEWPRSSWRLAFGMWVCPQAQQNAGPFIGVPIRTRVPRKNPTFEKHPMGQSPWDALPFGGSLNSSEMVQIPNWSTEPRPYAKTHRSPLTPFALDSASSFGLFLATCPCFRIGKIQQAMNLDFVKTVQAAAQVSNFT